VTHQSGQEAAVGGQNAREKSFYRHVVGGGAKQGCAGVSARCVVGGFAVACTHRRWQQQRLRLNAKLHDIVRVRLSEPS
jgi:hypothetical protein